MFHLARVSVVNAEAHSTSAEILFYSSLGQILCKVMSNKNMQQKQVYSTIRNIVALTFIISGCSGKLKLRMHPGQTRS